MTTEISALLLYDSPDPLNLLTAALQGPGLRIRVARTCAEARRELSGPKPPDLVFTDIKLPDGDWSDVVRLAEGARAPVNVIVVSRLVDIPLYVQAIEQGAFDFITPPFEPSDVSYVIRCAAGNVMQRKELEARTERSAQKPLTQIALQTLH
ncbi:MAG: response regulator [Burkholderiales bacterium]